MIQKSYQVDICSEKLSSTCSGNFLRITIDNSLTFEEQIEGLCKKASQKVIAVAKISSFTIFEQRKSIVNLFITFHFSYRPLVLMFHSRRLNNRIDHNHKWILKDLIDRSSHRKCSVRNVILRNFAKFTGKHLREGLFFDKVAGFPVNFEKFLRTSFYKTPLGNCFCFEFWQMTFT